MAHRASAAHARNTARLDGKPLEHVLRHGLRETPATLLTRGYAALVIVTAERTTVSIDVRNFHEQVSLTFPKSKLLTEGDLAVDADLIRRGTPFEKIGQFLHVLQIHKRKRVSRAEELRHSQHREALVGDEFEIGAHIPQRQPGNALA